MDIIIVGSGNVATILGVVLKNSGHKIMAVIGRNPDSVQALATNLDAQGLDIHKNHSLSADVVLIALSDSALTTNFANLKTANAVWAHTAGSVSKDVLKGYNNDYGVFYPLQSLNKHKKEYPSIPFLIDGNTEKAKSVLAALANSISTSVSFCTDEDRLKYHVGAVFVSNFTNHLYRLVQDYCEQQNISFEFLLPLIEETVQRLHSYKAAEVQTGPAVRGDKITLDKHLQLLQNEPQLTEVYLFLSKSIMAM